MTDSEIIKTVQDYTAPVAAMLGLEIWGIELTRGGRTMLRIFVDAPLGSAEKHDESISEGDEGTPPSATIDQCEEISRTIALALEAEDIISEAYVLEVSSPGLTRTIFRPEQLAVCMDNVIEATLSEALPDSNRKRYCGVLTQAEQDSFTLNLCSVSPDGDVEKSGELVTLPWNACRKVIRRHVFVRPQKPGKSKKKTEK